MKIVKQISYVIIDLIIFVSSPESGPFKMRHYILTLILTAFCLALFGQAKDSWISFYNKDKKLIGFKDKNGVTKIEPKFMGMTSAKKFDFIIAVTEEENKKWKNYYLTKSGRVVGRDSLYTFDNGCDCENEGFIRFRDNKTDKVGIFNRKGDIVIQAEYDELTNVRNGMIMALKGAEKKYFEGGEHYEWIGGQELLMDTTNKVLVENFKFSNNLNFSSKTILNSPGQDSLREYFKAVDGSYYSFINFNNEFDAWLKTELLNNFTKESLADAMFDEVTFWKDPKGWKKEQKRSFIERNFELIKSKLLELNSAQTEYSIFNEGLNQFMFTSNYFKEFYNNCGESKDWIYPVRDIVINHKDKGDLIQDSFEFLRTGNGYKLVCISVKMGHVK